MKLAILLYVTTLLQHSIVTSKSTMNLAIIFYVTTLLHHGIAETGEAYHGPPQARELFSYNDQLYYFYSDRCSYEEAKAICDASNMHLATLEDPAKAKFAAESISEAWMVFEDMWIGGVKDNLGRWRWEFIQKPIPDEPQMIGNYTYLYPPWVDNEVPSRDGKDCLAIDRNGHNDPYFVDLDCKLPRPFICEQNTKQNASDPWNGGTVEIFDLEFILYHGRLTWSEAVSFCRQQGAALASIDNMSVARQLAKAMLKSRPEFEDVWIGANLKDDNWVWVESGEEIKTIPAEYKDPKKGETPDNIITPQFPPWFETKSRKSRDCVIFDRHLCEEPRFIDLKCNRLRDFVCIRREQLESNVIEPKVLDREKKRYIFFPVTATWDEARQICDEQGDDATMLNLTDIDETKFIMQAMADARKPIDHIWLGGKLINNQWTWIVKDEYSPGNRPISGKIDETGFPPWCDNETNSEMACLNLDRQNHWTPLLYGLECNSTQSVVCVQPIQPTDSIVPYEEATQTTLLRVTKLTKNPISWYEAQKACSRDVGQLWRPPFDLPDSKAAIDKMAQTLLKQQEKGLTVYHVNGGHYSAKQKLWVYNGKTVNISSDWEPYDGDCLVGQVQNTSSDWTSANWTWFAVKCHHKLYSQIICQPYCSLSDVPYEGEHSEWVCDAASSEIFDHKMTGMGCNHQCRENRVAEGPQRFYCSSKGWFSTQSTADVSSSVCRNVSDGLASLNDASYSKISSLVFVIDSTSDSPADYNATKFLIGNLIDYYRIQISNISVSVVSMEIDPKDGEGATVKVASFKPEGPDCSQIKREVLDVLVDTGEGVRDFAAGLDKLKVALNGTYLDLAHIFFVVPDANQRSSFKEKARIINRDARVIAIGTNRHAPINQLVDLASTIDDQNYAIQFKKPSDVIEAVRTFMATCDNCTCKSAFNDLAQFISNSTNFQSNETEKNATSESTSPDE